MPKYPVKSPLVLALLSAGVMPVLMITYLGLFTLNIFGLLSIFSTAYTVLGVVLPFLFLLLTWGNVYLLHSLLSTLPGNLLPVQWLRRLWILLAFFAGALTILSPLLSMFTDSDTLNALWFAAFCLETTTGVILGFSLSRFAYAGRNVLLLALGIALSTSFLTDACGLKVFQPTIEMKIIGTELPSDADASVGDWLGAFLGISPTEFETLDDESLADVQEAVVGGLTFATAIFAGAFAFHAVVAALFFVLCALYFARKKSPRPMNRFRGHSKNQEVQIC